MADKLYTQAEVGKLILEARIEELLTVDDEVRLHNKIEGSYQEWFTKRLNTLKDKVE